MKFIIIAIQVMIIYMINRLGEWIQSTFNVPVPGSIIGLLLLFILLACHIIPEKWVSSGANFLLNIMALFFIPATVGVINYLDIFKGNGILLVIAMIISTMMVMISSGLVSEFLRKRIIKREKKEKYSA